MLSTLGVVTRGSTGSIPQDRLPHSLWPCVAGRKINSSPACATHLHPKRLERALCLQPRKTSLLTSRSLGLAQGVVTQRLFGPTIPQVGPLPIGCLSEIPPSSESMEIFWSRCVRLPLLLLPLVHELSFVKCGPLLTSQGCDNVGINRHQLG